MRCPPEPLKDAPDVPEGKKLTAGEPLDFLEEVGRPERQVEVVDEVEGEGGVQVGVGVGWLGVHSKLDLEEGAGDHVEPIDLTIQTRNMWNLRGQFWRLRKLTVGQKLIGNISHFIRLVVFSRLCP